MLPATEVCGGCCSESRGETPNSLLGKGCTEGSGSRRLSAQLRINGSEPGDVRAGCSSVETFGVKEEGVRSAWCTLGVTGSLV